MWKEVILAKFKALSRHLPRVTEENYNKTQDSQCVSCDSNQAPPKYKEKSITISAIDFKDPVPVDITLLQCKL
jgi:hypothetical protein